MATHIDYGSGISYGNSGQGISTNPNQAGLGSNGSDITNLHGISSEELSRWLQDAFQQTNKLDEVEMFYNSAEAQKNRDWQERMSNTSYQRAVKDLEAAGLNKWLAVNGGSISGASTPSGASASASTGSESISKIIKSFIAYCASLNSTAMKSLFSLIDFF